MLDLNLIRNDFPILKKEIYGKKLVYLDNAATTQKPLCVIEAMNSEYLNANANVHRGVHYLSQRATDLHEEAREKVREFIGAEKPSEIVFTRGTTEGINLVASSFSDAFMKEGDEIILSDMEHHSNIVPWQLAAKRKGLVIRTVPITDDGLLDIEAYARLLDSGKVKMVSLTHVSNVIGTVNPVDELVRMAHAKGAAILIDGAQSAPHIKIDVKKMDPDFFVLSGHKMYGPTGIGVLYGKEKWLTQMPPYQGGGEMIKSVSWQETLFEDPPLKFEAGTPDYIASHGLATAIDYLNNIGLDNISEHEKLLTYYCMEKLKNIDGIHIVGPEGIKGSVVSFNVGNIHHLDIGTLLDRLGIAVRTGHHCAQPLMDRYGIKGTVRASIALYNTIGEIDALADGIKKIMKMF